MLISHKGLQTEDLILEFRKIFESYSKLDNALQEFLCHPNVLIEHI